MNRHKEKSRQLGMPHSTANYRLRKMILFSLLKEFHKNHCFRCGKVIKTIEELSIEHKVPWLHKENATELFFDLNNIAFSHLSCNCGASGDTRKIVSPEGMSWCCACKQHKPIDDFIKNKSRPTGIHNECKICHYKLKKESRARR